MDNTPIKFDAKKLSKKKLKSLFYQILKPRMIEEKMLILLRQGVISKWFAGIGEEAISVGCAVALDEDEMIFTMHRNLGVFTTRRVPLERLFAQWQGKPLGFTKGRDRSFHFGAPQYNIVGMISHLGPQLSLASGVALASKLKGLNKVSLVFTGYGGTSQGEFHEALNVAAVWQLPVIFVVVNNGYGLSTPVSEQYACKDLADRAIGYGMKSKIVDGNNVIAVYDTIHKVATKIRKKPAPYLIECKTFRTHGHEEASGVKYVPKDLIEHWKKKDPVSNFEEFVLKEKLFNSIEIDNIRKEIKQEIEQGLKIANESPSIDPDFQEEMNDIFAPHRAELVVSEEESKEMRLIDAIADGLNVAMDRYENLVLMGQDIADYGGVFKATEHLMDTYGKGRVRNTPLCESAILGIGIGLSMKGYKSMVEMQFADFVTCGFNQIVNNAAKLHYRWGQNVDMVIRMPTGGGVAAGPFHSQSNEAWFTHVPGLKVVYPSNAIEAKGLLLASIDDPNPVLFFEHKALYRQGYQSVPTGFYTEEIGKANLVSEGESISIITYGMGVIWAENAAAELDVDIEILDLRTLVPLDYDSIEETVKKTHRVIILHEDNLFGGIGGELSAYIGEHLFDYLDAPVMRVGGMDTPIPFLRELENQYMPYDRLLEKINALMAY